MTRPVLLSLLLAGCGPGEPTASKVSIAPRTSGQTGWPAAKLGAVAPARPSALGSADPGTRSPSSVPAAANLLADLDALEARIAALDHGPGLGAECLAACDVVGIESVTVRRGEVSCRCRRVPNLGVVKIARAP